eukprot:scaffold131956_cov15-Tisochrysis_lutea.AAC.1
MGGRISKRAGAHRAFCVALCAVCAIPVAGSEESFLPGSLLEAKLGEALSAMPSKRARTAALTPAPDPVLLLLLLLLLLKPG